MTKLATVGTSITEALCRDCAWQYNEETEGKELSLDTLCSAAKLHARNLKGHRAKVRIVTLQQWWSVPKKEGRGSL